jgi:hypothetical protein
MVHLNKINILCKRISNRLDSDTLSEVSKQCCICCIQNLFQNYQVSSFTECIRGLQNLLESNCSTPICIKVKINILWLSKCNCFLFYLYLPLFIVLYFRKTMLIDIFVNKNRLITRTLNKYRYYFFTIFIIILLRFELSCIL